MRSACLPSRLLLGLLDNLFSDRLCSRCIRYIQSQRDKIASAVASPKKSHNSISISKLTNSRKWIYHEETKNTKKTFTNFVLFVSSWFTFLKFIKFSIAD